MRTRRTILIATLALMTSLAAHAQTDYPSKPVRLVIPYAPGGGTDNTSRMVAKAMSVHLGQNVIVDNKPGGGTIIGAMEVVRAPADGYTLFWSDNTTYAVNPFLHKKLPYSPLEDFAPITRTLSGSLVLAVHPSLPVTTVRELVAYAKANPAKLSYASAGQGTPHHFAMEMLKSKTGTFLVHLPYRGEGPAVQDVVAGNVPVLFLGSRNAKSFAEAGRLRLLATSGPERNAALPDLPTLDEAGVAGYESTFWHVLSAPAGTPKPILDKIRDAYAKALRDPEVVNFAATTILGSQLLVTSADAARAHIVKETATVGPLIKAIGLTVD